jgi:cytochrome P450
MTLVDQCVKRVYSLEHRKTKSDRTTASYISPMLAPADPDLVPFDPPEHPSWRATFRNVIETYPRALYGERGCVRYRSGP